MHSNRVLVSSSQVGGERLDSTGTVGNTNCGLVEWQRKQFPGDGQQRQSPRALIDAYGTDKSHEIKPLLVERLDRNGIKNKVLSTSWQNTEEEEFDWEDMSPTLVDHSRNNGFLRSTIRFSRERPVILAVNGTSLEKDTRMGGSGGSQLPLVDDSSVIAEDVFPSSAVCFSPKLFFFVFLLYNALLSFVILHFPFKMYAFGICHYSLIRCQ